MCHFDDLQNAIFIVVKMTTSLTRLGPAFLENRCRNVKLVTMILRLCSENGRENTPTISRPMVTAEELNLAGVNSKKESDDDNLEAPTTCCMSGCANCVWIEYAEKLGEKLVNSKEDVQKIIMDKVQDPNMRAFLSMELRCRNLIKT